MDMTYKIRIVEALDIGGENMDNFFIEALEQNDSSKLLKVPKSDLHNHSTKGCRLDWLKNKVDRDLPKPPRKFSSLDEMNIWFSENVKPFCEGSTGVATRWEGAFAEAKRNNIIKLAMSFGTPDIDRVGGIYAFEQLIEGFHKMYCPDTVFEPEITYASTIDAKHEAEIIDKYLCTGYFRSIDICGIEKAQPVENYLPLFKKAEEYKLIKKMHVGETGSADDVKRAVETLGLTQVHHGFNAFTSREVMKYLAENDIQLNICPSSNVMLGVVKEYKYHPIKVLVENGVKATINTDDLLIFDSSIENEYLVLYQAGTLSAAQLDMIRITGLS